MTTRSINVLLYQIQSRNSPPPQKSSIKNPGFPQVDVKFDLNHPSFTKSIDVLQKIFIKKISKKPPSPAVTLIFVSKSCSPPAPSSCSWKIWTPTKNTDIFQKKKQKKQNKKKHPLYFSVNNWWPWQHVGLVTKEITKLTHTGMIITWSPVRALDWSIFNRSSSR